tara:strand:- start:448 stop:885 length:438 start_codon:yes stop_codon:yes gene_type:complete
MDMTIYHYIAYKNPNGAKNVLNSFGEKAIRKPEILAEQLANTVRKHGKEALFRIASVHPDLKLVSEYNKVATKNDEPKEKPCSCDKEKESLFSSAEGQDIKKSVELLTQKQNQIDNSPKEQKSDSKELMIVGAVVVIALALVMKK